MAHHDLIERYRLLRGIAADIQDGVLGAVPHRTMLEFARRLGAVRRGEICLEDQEFKLVADLAIHTGLPGRSRAIERYARTATLPPAGAEAQVLAALLQAQFTLFQVGARHPVAGVMVQDILSKEDFHFMDVSMGLSAKPGMAFAGRLAAIDGFRMSCLTVIPFRHDLLERALPRLPSSLNPEVTAFQDPRFATALYRAALELGYMQYTVTFDVVEEVPTQRDVAAAKELNGHLSLGLPALTAVY